MVLKGSKTVRNTGNTTRSGFSSRRIRKLVPHHNHFLKLMRKVRARETVTTYVDDDDDDEDFAPREVIPAHVTQKELGRSTAIRRWLCGLRYDSDLAGSGSRQKQRWHLFDYIARVLHSVKIEKEPFKISLKNVGVLANHGVWEERHRAFLDLYLNERESLREIVRSFTTVSTDPSDTKLWPMAASVGHRLYTLWCELWEEREQEETAARQRVEGSRTARVHNQHHRGVQRRLPNRHVSVPPRAKRRTIGGKTTGGGTPIPEQPQPVTAGDVKRKGKFWSVSRFQRRHKFSSTRKQQDRLTLAEQMASSFHALGATTLLSGKRSYHDPDYAGDVDTFLTSVVDSDEEEFRPPRSNVFSLMDFATSTRKKLRPLPDKRPRTPLHFEILPTAPPDKMSSSRQASFFLTEVTDFDAAFSDVDGALCTCTLPAGDLKARPVRAKFGSSVDFGKCVPFTAVFNLRGAVSMANDGGQDNEAGMVDAGWLLVCQAVTSPSQQRVSSGKKDSRVKVSFKLHGGADSGAAEDANTALRRSVAVLHEDAGRSVFPTMDALLKHACDALSQDPPHGQQGSAQSHPAGNVYQSQIENSTTISGNRATQDFMETRCSNCFTLYDGKEISRANVPLFISITTCGHIFCRKCWQRHLVCAILSGKRTLLCMGYKCGNTVDATTVLSLVPHWAFLRWQQLLMLDVPSNYEAQTRVAETLDVPKQRTDRSLDTAATPLVSEKKNEVQTVKRQRRTIAETTKTTPRQGPSKAGHPSKEKHGLQLAVAGEKMPRQKRPVKATGPVVTPRLKPKAEPEVLSKTSLVHLARGLGKDNNGLTLPMLLNMPTTAIINAIYDNDDIATKSNNVTTAMTSSKTTTNNNNNCYDNKKIVFPEILTDKQRGVWMLEKCLLAWQLQTSGLQDDVRMRSVERALIEMGKGKLAADIMQCYRDKKKITPDLFKS